MISPPHRGPKRGNHNVMMRGTFANIRIKNEMVPGIEGGMTKLQPDGTVMPIYDAAMEYKKRGVPLVIFGGKEYGTGSSRDWAALSCLTGWGQLWTVGLARTESFGILSMQVTANSELKRTRGIRLFIKNKAL